MTSNSGGRSKDGGGNPAGGDPQGEIRAALAALFPPGRVIEVRIFGALRGKAGTVAGYYDDHDKAAADVARYDDRARGIYVVLNEFDPALLARYANRLQEWAEETTADHHVTRRRRLLIDCDPKRPTNVSSTDAEHAEGIARARAVARYLRAEGWPNPILTDSGNGGHLLYEIDLPNDPPDDREKPVERLVHRCLRALAARFDDERVQIDLKVANAARITKLYGTMTRKGDHTEDRPHRRARLLHVPEPVSPGVYAAVSREQLEALAAQAPEEAKGQSAARTPGNGPAGRAGAENGPFDMAGYISRHGIAADGPEPYRGGQRWRLDCPFNPDHKSPDAALYVTADGAAAFRCSHNSCANNDWHALRDRLEPGWRERKADAQDARRERAARREKAKAENSERAAAAGKLPVIETSDRHFRDVCGDALGVLLSANAPTPEVFARGRQLVRVAFDRDRRCVVAPVDVVALRGRLARVANFVSTSEREGTVPVPPPTNVCEDVLALPDLPRRFPALDAIVGAPVLSPKRTVETAPGYLPDAHVYHHAADERPIPDTEPTAENVAAAKSLLLGTMLADFPFVDDASRAHALCLLLLPLVRPAIVGPTPIHLIDAPAQGTGKSLLAEACLFVSQGTFPAATYCPGKRDDDEWRKKITAVLMDGPAYVWLDNLKFRLDSGALAQALTSLEWKDRILGSSQTTTVPVRCAWVLTGNNLELDGDFPRRSLWVRLDSQVERPEDRDSARFKVANLREWLHEQRPALVAAALTLVRKWLADGAPAWSGKPIGSYESYCRVMGGVLEAAGVPGFLANREDLYERADAERNKWQAFVDAWWKAYDEQLVGVKDLIEIAVEAEMVGDSSRGGVTSLGTMLRHQVDRIYGGLRVLKGKELRRAARYRLSPMKPQALKMAGESGEPRCEPPATATAPGREKECEPGEPCEPSNPRARTRAVETDANAPGGDASADARAHAYAGLEGSQRFTGSHGDEDAPDEDLTDPFADEEEDVWEP